MKKILFVIESLHIGGMERVQVDIANALIKRGYDVTILMYNHNPKTSNFISELDARIRLIEKPKKTFPIMSKLPYFHRKYRGIKWETRVSAKTLYKYYVGNKEKYDVEVAFYRGPSVKIVSGSPNKKSLKIAWVHNDYKLVDSRSISYFFKNMEDTKNAYKKFDRIVAVSEQARKNFIDVIGYSEKTTTIYNMVSTRKILEKSKEFCVKEKEKFTFISVGRLIEAKGYDKLLNVVNRLNNEGFEFELWLVGSGRCEEELKKYVQDNKITNVCFLGQQLNPYAFMSKADVYVCSSWREGFSIVIAEAMTCGLPIVSTECTGPSEVLGYGEYGILIENSEEKIYDTLKKVLNNLEDIEFYSKKSIERSQCFDENVIIEQIEALISN